MSEFRENFTRRTHVFRTGTSENAHRCTQFCVFFRESIDTRARRDIMNGNMGELFPRNKLWSDNSMSQFQQSMVDEQANAGMVVPEAENRKPSAGGYRTLAVIAFVLAVGGLFIGLLYALSGVFWEISAAKISLPIPCLDLVILISKQCLPTSADFSTRSSQAGA